jgi:hypothetical protein
MRFGKNKEGNEDCKRKREFLRKMEKTELLEPLLILENQIQFKMDCYSCCNLRNPGRIQDSGAD